MEKAKPNFIFVLGEGHGWSTLEGCQAKFKFGFIPHLVGGLAEQARGGSKGFKEHRPGWPLPIHQVLGRNHVNIVFHGHDHLFAKQKHDGGIYQEGPQPDDPHGSTRSAADYGYTSGVLLGSSGHLRGAVTPQHATITYLRSDGTTAHTLHQPRPTQLALANTDRFPMSEKTLRCGGGVGMLRAAFAPAGPASDWER